MRVYAEAMEIEAPVSPEFIRLDATGKDFTQVLSDLKAMLHPDKKYELRKHFCLHDIGGGCWVESVE